VRHARAAAYTGAVMRLTTSEKVRAGFIIALALIAVIGAASLTSIRRFTETSRELGRTHEVLRHLQSMMFSLTDAESAHQGYLLTGRDEFLSTYDAAAARVHRQIRLLREQTFEHLEQQQRLAIIGGLAARRLGIMNELTAQRRSGNRDDAMETLPTQRGKAVMDSLRAVVHVMDRAELDRLSENNRLAVRNGRIAIAIIAAGGVFAFLVVLASALMIRRDYTERRRAEFALRNSETLLSQFMENLPIGVVVIDAQSRLRFANNSAIDMVGPSMLIESDGRPLPLYRLNELRPYPEAENPLVRALAGNAAAVQDAEVRADGREFPVEIAAAPIYDARGRISYAIATFSDVTERRRAEEALRSAKEAAEAANRTKSDFLARMSHELRTPLNSVIGFANIVMKNRSGTLRQQELAYLERILENGKHLLLLINDILDLSKIEAGKVEIEVAPTDVGEAVRRVVAQLEEQTQQQRVALRTSVPSELEPVVTDVVRLRQILLNLVGNALKFTERGVIEVRIETTPDSNAPARIVVEDTGIGIPEDRLEAIFDAFEQAESSTTRKYGGTGLGLPISRALCELLGYELTVRSELGVGTAFTLQPSRTGARRDVAAQPLARPVLPRAEPDRLVLIVDDQADSRILLTHYVEDFGCRAIATHSAASAITLARELKPDLITLDLMMPGMNGWDLLAELKADPVLASIPVIVVSMVAQESRASLLGAIDLVQKPVDREALFRVLRRNFGSSRPRILVVEDSADMRRVMRDLLEELAAELRMAEHGQEALTVLREFAPDIIITDLLMPVMDGLTFLEILRGTARFQHVPVIVVTAKELTADEQERLRRHTRAVLQKGGNAVHTDLRRLLQSMLGAGNGA
jgi:PAS domain S-box-containing protein